MPRQGHRQVGGSRPQDKARPASDPVTSRAGKDASALELTPREVEILQLLPSGLSDTEIASRLGISPRTVSKHIEHILEKLAVSSRTAAAVAWVAREKGIRVDDPGSSKP